MEVLSEDFTVDDEVEEGSEVPWIHFEQDVVNLHTQSASNSSSASFSRSSCSSRPSITALNIAAKVGFTEVVKLLVSHHASVNTQDQYARTPLMHACHRGNLELISFLLANGSNVSAFDFQHRTAVFYATHGGHSAALELVLQTGCCSVNATDIWGQNALHAVTWTDHVHIAKLLLSLGCDHRKEDKFRIIPALLAVKICSSSILECLLKHDPKFHLGMTLIQFYT